jgi:hypothetical protein
VVDEIPLSTALFETLPVNEVPFGSGIVRACTCAHYTTSKPHISIKYIGFAHCTKHPWSPKLLSWVLDWTACPYDIQILGNYDPWISSFFADGHILEPVPALLQALIAQRSWQPSQLPVLGVELGQLMQVGQASSVGLDISGWPTLIEFWASFVPNMPTYIFI